MKAHVTKNAYSGKGVVQVVQGPGNDDNVVNVQPEWEYSSRKTNTCSYDSVL